MARNIPPSPVPGRDLLSRILDFSSIFTSQGRESDGIAGIVGPVVNFLKQTLCGEREPDDACEEQVPPVWSSGEETGVVVGGPPMTTLWVSVEHSEGAGSAGWQSYDCRVFCEADLCCVAGLCGYYDDIKRKVEKLSNSVHKSISVLHSMR